MDAKNLKELRAKLEMTQASFGARLGLSWYQVRDMESGKVEISTAMEKAIISEFGLDRVAESRADYKKTRHPRVEKIADMLNDMDDKDVEEIFSLVQDKKQAAAWRREKKLKEGA